ncbi:MAG: hypothetical protein IRY91_05930 [Gemmatimonadaceae bacterium]|nr:hypothetical protein [Gemmatimonadaceae bacterium]
MTDGRDASAVTSNVGSDSPHGGHTPSAPLLGVESTGQGRGTATPHLRRINSSFTKRYAITVIVGLVPVFISASFWWIPVLAMLGFLGTGYQQADSDGMVYEFADAFYYLGFTLSIGSLLAALDPFHAGARPDAARMLHQFGLGMFTTLIGVTGRTVLQSYHRLPSETLESINREIAEQGREYVDHLRQLNARIATLLADSVDEYQTRVVNPLSRLGDAIEQCLTVAMQTIDHALALRDSTDHASSAVQRTAAGSLESMEKLGAAAAEARGMVYTVATHLTPVLQGPESLPELATHVGRATRTAIDVVTTDVERLRASVQAFAGSSTDLREAVGKIETTGIASRIAALEEALQRVAATVDEQERIATKQAAAVAAQLDLATKAAAEVNTALDEVAKAVAVRLERIA